LNFATTEVIEVAKSFNTLSAVGEAAKAAEDAKESAFSSLVIRSAISANDYKERIKEY
jgi:hypothetical protein